MLIIPLCDKVGSSFNNDNNSVNSCHYILPAIPGKKVGYSELGTLFCTWTFAVLCNKGENKFGSFSDNYTVVMKTSSLTID